MLAGYSGTPLATKLGIRAGHTVVMVNETEGLRRDLTPLPVGVVVHTRLAAAADVVVAFTMQRSELRRRLPAAGRSIFPGGALWIAWPKRASGMPTDMTEDVIRAAALPRGLVDNKVCAIDDTWSGLRLVWRVGLRSAASAP